MNTLISIVSLIPAITCGIVVGLTSAALTRLYFTSEYLWGGNFFVRIFIKIWVVLYCMLVMQTAFQAVFDTRMFLKIGVFLAVNIIVYANYWKFEHRLYLWILTQLQRYEPFKAMWAEITYNSQERSQVSSDGGNDD